MIAVVDYDRGNLFSLARSLDHVGAAFTVTHDAEEISRADGVILPGVGAFADAMAALKKLDLIDVLRGVAAAGTPMLGICLGMQLLFSRSEEFGESAGLDIIAGEVRKLPSQDGGVRIPNVGWRRLNLTSPDDLLDGEGENAMFYFVHSFGAFPEDSKNTVATLSINGRDATVLVRQEAVVGCQFHPEKSAAAGLALLKRFVAQVPLQGRAIRAA